MWIHCPFCIGNNDTYITNSSLLAMESRPPNFGKKPTNKIAAQQMGVVGVYSYSLRKRFRYLFDKIYVKY